MIPFRPLLVTSLNTLAIEVLVVRRIFAHQICRVNSIREA